MNSLGTPERKCVDAGSHVISMSLGGGSKSRLEQRTLDSAWSKDVYDSVNGPSGGIDNIMLTVVKLR